MKDVLVVAHFCSELNGSGNNRFNYLCNYLSVRGFNVELVTSNYNHYKKEYRSEDIAELPYNVTLLKEPSYKKNISVKRFYSHYKIAKELEDYLDKRSKPDVIYCCVPSLSVAKVAARFADNHEIKFIIDVQDLWPEAFRMVLNIPLVSSVLFYPMTINANYIYSKATEIIAVSETYCKRALENNNICEKAHTVYLGTELSKFDSCRDVKPSSKVFKVGYVGTLGHSYDIRSVIDALSLLKEKGIEDILFIVMGDGPLKETFQKHAKVKNIDIVFTGRLPYQEMVKTLINCDIAVNPISSGAAQSIINKHADYAAAALPVINTQESPEYRNLVEQYSMGVNCKNGDVEDIAKNILSLKNNKDLIKEMGANSRKLAEELFDREKAYERIVTLIG